MTLYQLLNIPETTPPAMVESAALVSENGAGADMRRTALRVLSDPEARADYDARADGGLPLQLALAWGVAAFAADNPAAARDHWKRAQRIAPDNRAVTALLASVEDAEAEPRVEATEEMRAAAMAEVQRLHRNSAFPHRLIRYAEALARPHTEGEESGMVVGAARELLQYDIVEAPRAYAMILPVLKEHYQATYALDASFFDATLSVLADHTPRAEYERKKRAPREPQGAGQDYDLADLIGPTGPSGPSGRSRAPSEDPPREAPRQRIEMPVLPRLPAPGPAWIGALFGALFGLRLGLFGMIRGALFGFLITYVLLIIINRQR